MHLIMMLQEKLMEKMKKRVKLIYSYITSRKELSKYLRKIIYSIIEIIQLFIIDHLKDKIYIMEQQMKLLNPVCVTTVATILEG
mgnify:FL=1